MVLSMEARNNVEVVTESTANVSGWYNNGQSISKGSMKLVNVANSTMAEKKRPRLGTGAAERQLLQSLMKEGDDLDSGHPHQMDCCCPSHRHG